MRRSSYLLLNALLVLSLAMGLPSGARAYADAPLPARVLWDTSHGVMGRYQPGRRYSTLASSLLEQGIAVEESSAGVTHVNLSPYKVQSSVWVRPGTPRTLPTRSRQSRPLSTRAAGCSS